MAKDTGFDEAFKNLHGGAELYKSSPDDQTGFASPGGTSAVPLGRGLSWNLRRYQGHGVTFGATRSGKGVCSIIPALLSYGGSMVVIDPKGENAWTTALRRQAMGQRVVILDPWGEVHKRYGSKASPPVNWTTTRFNPLSFMHPDSEDFADDVAAVADAMVIPGSIESHWSDSAKELISGLVAARVELEPGKAHLGSVRQAITASDEDLASLVKSLAERNPDSLSTRKLRRFAKVGESKEVTSIRSTAETQTAILDSKRLIASMMTGEPPFNLEDLATSRVTLYLVLPLDRLQTHGRWLRLILTMAIRAIARLDTQPAVPVLFMLDEMGTIGKLTMIEQAFGLMAGVGIRVWAYLQDINQLERDYPQSWETFISNASVVQALKVSDLTTSKYLSELLGTRTLWQMQEGAHRAAFASSLMLPQEIRDMPGDKVLNIFQGRGNYLVDRLPYFASDSIWKGQYQSPPWFAAANAAQPTLPPEPPKRKGFFT